ncbi:plexin domain-containing protein 2 isoform X1 [Drosophila bipectinata]|uniref:plexin domain-containing protein 2 isoform X1 n=1 Tax=Drosophila bipectinata TaxID=42026 RepID=UPI001C88EF03|nr:plexin domain-containing protein 2 isoform X1 [Drosophila bipectinata]
MAKKFGARSACAQIAILLAVCGALQSAAALSNPDTYQISDSSLPYLHAAGVETLQTTGERLHRQRRAPPASAATPDAKSQYQSINAGNVTAEATVTTVDTSKAVDGSVSYNVHNVGVNGTGQRKDYTVQNADGSSAIGTGTSINVAAKKPTQLLASQSGGYPKKVAASAASVAGGAATTTSTTPSPTLSPGIDVEEVDVPEDDIEKNVKKESLQRNEDTHEYYNSSLYVSKSEASSMWEQLKNISENKMLSSSHRRAMTVELNFDFPFYGHNVRNVTVATGGFLYTGEYVHSWLAATQYIAPLMANFDTSISNDSFVRMLDNGTAFTALWENATLQDNLAYGKFTFSVTLHKNGDIVFAYYQIPTQINAIQDNQHPVKVGLSDAYIIDKHLYFARRKTIYEYHRVSFQQHEISNSTIIRLTALPTCLGYNDCQSCINHNTTFTCLWCPALNRCSTGTDRKKHEWEQKGCNSAAVRVLDSCPALGEKGNNAAKDKNAATGKSDSATNSGATSTAATASSAVTEPTVVSTRSPSATAQSQPAAVLDGAHVEGKLGNAELSQAGADNKSVGVAFGFMVPICLVFAVTLWLFYAYRNPHTKSGQLLIQSKHLHQFRPSQWSWRRGEARYTAATIHM